MIFGIKELNARYSDLITDYLNKGYVISPFTNSYNSSSAKPFLDLVNPKEKNVIYRVWFKTAYSKGLALLKIEVRKYNRNAFCGILRPDGGDIVNERSFFVVSEKGGFADSEDEIARVNKCKVDKLPADFIDNIMACITRFRGFKR